MNFNTILFYTIHIVLFGLALWGLCALSAYWSLLAPLVLGWTFGGFWRDTVRPFITNYLEEHDIAP